MLFCFVFCGVAVAHVGERFAGNELAVLVEASVNAISVLQLKVQECGILCGAGIAVVENIHGFYSGGAKPKILDI